MQFCSHQQQTDTFLLAAHCEMAERKVATVQSSSLSRRQIDVLSSVYVHRQAESNSSKRLYNQIGNQKRTAGIGVHSRAEQVSIDDGRVSIVNGIRCTGQRNTHLFCSLWSLGPARKVKFRYRLLSIRSASVCNSPVNLHNPSLPFFQKSGT